MLTTNTKTPEVSETTVGTDFLETLQVVTEFGVNSIGENLAVLAVDNVF